MSGVEDLVQRDREARRAAQSVFDRPVVVEAGAGTGKTSILVARVLSWALGSGWEEARDRIDAEHREARKGAPPPADELTAAAVLETIVAITFTEAAAAEMAGRVAERLARVAVGEPRWPGFDPSLIAGDPTEDELAARARALLGQLDRLTACTIHAFCHALLRRHPLEARLHPDFAIDARGERIEEIVRSVVEDGVKRAYSEASSSPGAEADVAPLLVLAAEGKSPQAVADALLAFVLEGVPSAGLETDPFHPDVVGEISRGLISDFGRLLEIAAGDLSRIKRATNPARLEEALRSSLDSLRQAEEAGNEGLAAARVISETLRSCWSDGAWKHFKSWSKGKFLKGEESTLAERTVELGEIARRLVPRISYLRSARPDFLDAARRAILPLLREVERQARSRGVVTFQALLREAWRLLREHPRILRRERRGIRQLLVDEFQDTDRLQCDIVELLAFPEAAEAERAPHALGLFIVGDPKQSIYGWRNADLEAYNRLVALALDAGGERFSLVRNFRSHPEVLAEVERAMTPVMIEEAGLQPPFEPLVASVDPEALEARSGSDALRGRSRVEYWISWHPDWMQRTRQAEAAEIEARAIAEDIRALHDSGTAWKECALLMRNASRIDIYLDGFRRAGVPFLVTSDKQYFRRREVIDASALLRCIVSPADHLALVTWLRSPGIGVPDAALIPLWSRGFPHLMTELDGIEAETTRGLLDELAAVVEAAARATPDVPGLDRIQGWPKLLVHSLRTLAVLRRSFGEEPADRFMEHLRCTFLSEAIEGARYLGRYRVSNLERLFRSFEAGLEAGGGDVQAVLRTLRRSVTMALDAEEALPQDAAEDAVQVMTIHKAKGLEFGHVYLAQLHAQGRSSERNEFDSDRRWDGFRQLEYSLFDVPTLGFDTVERHRERVSAAEQVRTLYVAMTRAKERLVLVGNWPERPQTSRGAQPTYIELLNRRQSQPASILELSRSAGSQPDGVLDAAGVRWKLPGLDQRDEFTETAPTKVDLPTAKQVQGDVEVLVDRRRAASSRMDRPVLGRASLGADHDDAEEPAGAEMRLPYSRAAALEIGQAVHSALEAWDLAADAQTEADRQQEWILDYLEGRLSDSDLEAGREAATQMLVRIGRGGLLARLLANPGQVVARELPVLVSSNAIEGSEAISGVSGTVDLVLRDANGIYTVVDFKTDRAENDADLEKRAALYSPQLALYARAIGEGLDLEQPPRTELWFLWPDRVWPVA